MSLKYLHLLRPQESLLPGIGSWLLEVMTIMHECPEWDGCKIQEVIYDARGWFSAQSAADKILSALGPVVIVENVQTESVVDLAGRIGERTVIRNWPIGDSTSLWQLFEDARSAFVIGDPQRPRSISLAILLINKLEKEYMWGGKNKGYKWVGDLSTGRGIPAGCAGAMPNIINLLLGGQVLIKKTSALSHNDFRVNRFQF